MNTRRKDLPGAQRRDAVPREVEQLEARTRRACHPLRGTAMEKQQTHVSLEIRTVEDFDQDCAEVRLRRVGRHPGD
eukprot:7861465-Pyramimonas_sp.AAC.1